MITKTLLVDASYLLKKSYDGAKNAYTKAGFMGGVYGFLTTVRMLIKQQKFNKIVLMWDGENGGIHRHRIDYMYKSNRKDKSWYTKIELDDDEIRKEKEKEKSVLIQRKRVQQYAEELFFRQLEIDEIEADDLIAAYCIRNASKEDIYLYTNDRDFLILLSLGITIYLANKKTYITAGDFYLHFPFFYKNALTIKILCGDKSDVIEGIKGVQEKTLLNYFPELNQRHVTVREICQRSAEINEERKKKKLKPIAALKNITENVERLKTNHVLMNLLEPFLNDAAKEGLEQLDMPLSDENRGGNNVYELFMADDLLSLYSNYGNYSSYIEPFYPIIMKEKDLLKNFNKKTLNS